MKAFAFLFGRLEFWETMVQIENDNTIHLLGLCELSLDLMIHKLLDRRRRRFISNESIYGKVANLN